jgi:hypothetical protein
MIDFNAAALSSPSLNHLSFAFSQLGIPDWLCEGNLTSAARESDSSDQLA